MLFYVWLSVIIAAVLLELVTVDLVSIWVAVGSVFAIIALKLGLGLYSQVAVCVAVALVFIVLFRPFAMKYLKTNIVKTNLDRVVGKHGLVIQEINPDKKGEVKVAEQEWLASSLDNEVLVPGEHCEVMAIEGAHLIVRKIEE